ncbi:hypothetical protein SLS58_004061 [Diplodia intermedia]|uniref:Uncharacterized protein n=1 Tax=Diplodia intermedia TaxID=856260 RepID=A0ABR3TUR3_9PEZI
MVYQYLLRYDKPFDIWLKEFCVSFDGPSDEQEAWTAFARFKSALGILRLRKTINKEAAEVFYGQNEFRFNNINAFLVFRSFAVTIGTANTRFLRKISLRVPPSGMWEGELLPTDLHSLVCPSDKRNPIVKLRRRGMVTDFGDATRDPGLEHPSFLGAFVTHFRRLAADNGRGGGGALRELRLILPHGWEAKPLSREIMPAYHRVDAPKDCVKDLDVSLVVHQGMYGSIGTFGCLRSVRRFVAHGGHVHIKKFVQVNLWFFKEVAGMGWAPRHFFDYWDGREAYAVLGDGGEPVQEMIPGCTVAAADAMPEDYSDSLLSGDDLSGEEW